MPNFEKPVSIEAHHFATDKTESHGLRFRGAIPDFLRSFRIKVYPVVLPVGIVTESKQIIRRFDHRSVGVSTSQPNLGVLSLDLGGSTTMIAIGVGHQQPRQVFRTQTHATQI